jgi:hypothetical protein
VVLLEHNIRSMTNEEGSASRANEFRYAGQCRSDEKAGCKQHSITISLAYPLPSPRLPRPKFALPLPVLLSCLPSLPLLPSLPSVTLPYNIPVPPAVVMDITLLMYLPSRSWRRSTLKKRTLLIYGHILGGEIHSRLTLQHVDCFCA